MQLFSKFYNKLIIWSKHKYAPYILSGMSFAESSFFPLPPDIMLVTMTLADQRKRIQYAILATVFSVLGGILGYFLGMFFFNLIFPYIVTAGYGDKFNYINDVCNNWGFWVILIAGFIPIPYKVPYKFFTLGAGFMHINFVLFILASIIGRWFRYLLVVSATNKFEGQISQFLQKYMYIVGWVAILLFTALFYVFFYALYKIFMFS